MGTLTQFHQIPLWMHHMIAPKNIVANGQNIVEGAGEKKENNHTQERENDSLIVFFHYCINCGHFGASSYYEHEPFDLMF